jgi:antitoxin MazE
MQVSITRWGTSLGLCIQGKWRRRPGSWLALASKRRRRWSGRDSAARPRYVLADLMKDMTPEAMREAFDWGPAAGCEIVE